MALNTNDLLALLANTITSNGNNEVSAADLRSVLEQVIDSDINKLDDLTTQLEYFNKSSVKVPTPSNIALDHRVQSFQVSNSTGAVTEVIAAGGALNINSLLLESSESSLGVVPTFKDTANATQATFTDETNDKFLFPSNLHTFNNTYTAYTLRAVFTIDHGAVTTSQSINIYVSLRRVIDDSVVVQDHYLIHNHAADTDEIITFEKTTYVNSETDPYVVDGVYLEVSSDSTSSASFTLTNADIVIFK